ncbi:peptidyl prolyl cis-trans isomerase [Phlyctema vagabunda]|uniref:Peptidyl prolyl cis-trans isomerase n=1 Tax=Phlyctema vagabunda TaxID=108571 RepID=A0ABR4PUW9_9HELO
MTDQARWKATVYVGGLASMVTAANLQAAFLPFGEIADISLPKPEGPNSTELHRGFGYVEFEDPDDTKDAIDNMDQSELFGRVIKVSAAKPPKNVNEGLGSWLAENAVSDEDRLAAERAKSGGERADDPMQGLEGLDVAGPKPA